MEALVRIRGSRRNSDRLGELRDIGVGRSIAEAGSIPGEFEAVLVPIAVL